MIQKYWHCVLVLIIGYFIGVYFPAFGTGAVSKVQSITGA
jgi:hypothetical protein